MYVALSSNHKDWGFTLCRRH